MLRLFDRHRIIFWYDTKKELRGDFEGLRLDGIQKVELKNNQFAVKHRILREHPDQKFLLYHEGPQPSDLENWLLDVQLAHGDFCTDQVAIWLSELELGIEFADLVRDHLDFFHGARRREALKTLLESDDTHGMIRTKMLAVCAGSEPRLDSVLETLLSELSVMGEEKIKLIARCGLETFLWDQLKRHFGYESETPGLMDFVIQLFGDTYFMTVDPAHLSRSKSQRSKMTLDALVFLKRWKDSRRHEASFEALSEKCAEILSIEEDLGARDFRDLLELDTFRLIDQKIIRDLVASIEKRTVTPGDVALWVRQRRQGHWYNGFSHLYNAIDHAVQFIHSLDEAGLTMESLSDGVKRYSHSWYRLDQHYRKFSYHARSSGQASLMGALADQMEKLYSNNYLLKLNDRWQVHVDATKKWEAAPIPLQKRFFERWVRPFLVKEKKVCVVVSDAFRYEIGDEFLSLMRREDRFEAELEPALAMLPSYTQMGMAALLPHKELLLAPSDSGIVQVNQMSSQGMVNRIKILQESLSQRVTAIKAEDLMGLNKEVCRALIRDHDVVYVYHNRIDAVGDNRDSEERVFESVEETLQELVRLVKKLTGANANNLLVTTDHGFIYQNRAIEESDFLGEDVRGEEILFRDRRFVMGRGLEEAPGFKKFCASDLWLAGEMEVQIPKSINRLRVKGSGSRFVHGGASLQEVVIPVIKINKKRQSDISFVDVDILRGATSIITSGQLGVVLYQVQPVSEKVQPRTLRAGIYNQEGELISDAHELAFDLTSQNPRERELQTRFVLTRKADVENGREVILRLEEKVAGTSHYKEYKSLRYMMRRSFTSDFDF